MSKKGKIILAVVIAVVWIAIILLVAFFCGKERGTVNLENGGQSDILQTDLSPAEIEAREGAKSVAFAFVDKMSKLQSYKMTSKGESVASLLGYRQQVSDSGYKYGGEVYVKNTSSSPIANVNHEAFATTVDGVAKVAYRNDGGAITVLNRDGDGGYKSIYGISPDDIAIGGYIFNQNTLKSAERMDENLKYPGDLRYRFVLECSDEATAFVQLQMLQYGKLAEAPVFSSIQFEITMTANWEPREVYSHIQYSAKKRIGGTLSFTCDQNLTATYTDVNALTERPVGGAEGLYAALCANA